MAATIGAVTDGTANSDTYTVSFGTHAIGDLLIVELSIDNNLNFVNIPPDGWFQFANFGSGFGSTAVLVLGYAKIATSASEGFTLVMDSVEPAIWHTWVVSGHEFTDLAAQMPSKVNNSTGTGTAHNYAAVTGLTSTLQHVVILFDGTARGDPEYAPTAAPSGYSGYRSPNPVTASQERG